MTERKREAASTRMGLLWFRQDLRLHDNQALCAACEEGPVVAVYVLDEAAGGAWSEGGAARWWLHHSLEALAGALRERGGALLLRRGHAETIIPALAEELGAGAVHATVMHEPWARRRDQAVARALDPLGVRLHLHRGSTLLPPGAIRTKTGGVYGVYTPFARACREALSDVSPLPAPSSISFAPCPRGDDLADWTLRPGKPDWAGGLRAQWIPGEAGARARLDAYADGRVARYHEGRDIPGEDNTSMLSPHLHWGEISPDQVWAAVAKASGGRGLEVFQGELLWHEFAVYLLWHNQQLPDAPLRREFGRMPWRDDAKGLRRWQRGETGVPIVDAGMRQLWQTGWMHNRVRMIVASYLTKHLLIDWRLGEQWFWDTLVDADLAANSASWQWVAGSGADGQPFFRIFNPVSQGARFDPKGAYVRRFVPELAGLPDEAIHAPWEAPELALRGAGVVLGKTYPKPLVDLAEGRARALEAFQSHVKSRAA